MRALWLAVLLSGCISGPHARYRTAPPDTTAYKWRIPIPEPHPFLDPVTKADASPTSGDRHGR